ncbi:MAG: division/cell wall cluster transcriptional repressor MraZ [Panacagrimonas sp.]
MFSGSHQLTIDDKGRLAIPARYRQELADGCASQLFITRGPNPCLEIYPAPEFQRLAEQIQQMEDRDHAEVLKSVFIGFACETEIDKQGRVLLPPMLRKYAKFSDSAVLMGQITRFDLWPEELWQERFGEGPSSVMSRTADAFKALKR